MLMLLQFADKQIFIAGIGMLVLRRGFFVRALFLSADEHPTCAVTVGRMLVPEVLLQTATILPASSKQSAVCRWAPSPSASSQTKMASS